VIRIEASVAGNTKGGDEREEFEKKENSSNGLGFDRNEEVNPNNPGFS
jgi:hypothetical protein